MKVLVAGVSTRAIAESAARAGFAVTAIDAFADLDQHPAVHAISLGERFSPDAAVRLASTVACDAVAYGSNLENEPGAIARLAEGRSLWGNPPEVLRKVRDPKVLSHALGRNGFAAPKIADDESQIPNPESLPDRAWLLKRLASGGGHGVRVWRSGMRVPRGSYLQEFVDGVPASIVFVAAGGGSVPLGLCRQLIGDEAFGSSDFRYCGNILTASGDDDDVLDAAATLAGAVCEEFGLVGVNGIDFVVKGGAPRALEVNPRWCASMELVERAYGVSVFGVHAAACRNGALPNFDLARARDRGRTVGKAVIFARRDVVAGDTRTWQADLDVRDVPRAGTKLRAGQPVCTAFADGHDAAECYTALVRRAALVYARLQS